MFRVESLSAGTQSWLREQGLSGKRLRRFVTRRIFVPTYLEVRHDRPWQPSAGTRFATGDDIERIQRAVDTAYNGSLGEEYRSLGRLGEHIRANEIARAAGYEPAFACLREKSPGELIFMLAEIRRYRKTRKEYFDIEYFWIYEWVSTMANDSVELMAMLKDLRRFYGHVCSRAGRPLNVRGRAHGKTSYRVRHRLQASFERELAARGMRSTFKLVNLRQKGENTHIAANNSLNAEMDAARRKERAALDQAAEASPS